MAHANIKVEWTPPAGCTSQNLLIWQNGTGQPVNVPLASTIGEYTFTPAENALYYNVDRYANFGEENMLCAYDSVPVVQGSLDNLKITRPGG